MLKKLKHACNKLLVALKLKKCGRCKACPKKACFPECKKIAKKVKKTKAKKKK